MIYGIISKLDSSFAIYMYILYMQFDFCLIEYHSGFYILLLYR